ncbi:phosphotriesterase family protein [Pseudogracilibacillus auburnensis]|uniref:phosphotriesterase family protein n=1 Tax=Pseudogracilibacillus auburnensis TaxID=1494959 RepID=UPI001A979D9A|nr:phosphotriesterase [Pseudogracilibacillus auburnensis]MBO1003245.1 phosphotriesterase [Pseudogracilibacillus auburnensis]
MTIINSVTGRIDSSDLGCTLVHEHLRIRSESVFTQFPHLYDEEKEFQKAIEQVKAAKEQGVKTICDPTVMEMGRDIRFMEKISHETGVQIIASTGIYTYHYIPPHFQNRSIDYMTDLFVRDIKVGIQNTSIKAGFLKCATDVQGLKPDVEKVLRATARAHHKTGVPIMTHTHAPSETGLLQMKIFEEEGVKPDNIIIGHCGDTEDFDYIETLLDKGVFIGMDRYGITKRLATSKRNKTLIELVKRGYADRMFLSQDYCCSFDWFDDEVIEEVYPLWSMIYLFSDVIPELKQNGVTEEQIHMMMHENIIGWFQSK